MYQDENGIVRLTAETVQNYRIAKVDSLFDGTEVSPLTAALSQIGGLYALCIAATFIAVLILGKVA